VGVSRETLAALGERHALPAAALGQVERLLAALSEEADPPTTVREPARALDVHVADSLSGREVAGLRCARSVADLGSGAGFPGLPLAIADPTMRVDLIESATRKTAVIARLAQAAKIDNARAVTARAEEWAGVTPVLGGGREAYDAVTARALAPLAVLAEYAAPLLRDGGVLVAWKGGRDEDEEAAGRAAAQRLGLETGGVLHVVPFEGSERRHLHVFTKAGPTPEGFPRRPGMARKRPLA
jgi:16S rRNA (guanine527-N7)-methyltransferase